MIPYKGIIAPHSIIYQKRGPEILPIKTYREFLGYRHIKEKREDGLLHMLDFYNRPNRITYATGSYRPSPNSGTTGEKPTKCIIMGAIEYRGEKYFNICDHIIYYHGAPLRRIYMVKSTSVQVTTHVSEAWRESRSRADLEFEEYEFLKAKPKQTYPGKPLYLRRP